MLGVVSIGSALELSPLFSLVFFVRHHRELSSVLPSHALNLASWIWGPAQILERRTGFTRMRFGFLGLSRMRSWRPTSISAQIFVVVPVTARVSRSVFQQRRPGLLFEILDLRQASGTRAAPLV